MVGRGEKRKLVRPCYFSLQAHQNSITPNWGENTRKNIVTHFQTKLPLANTNVQHCAFFLFYLFHEFASCSHLFLPSFYYRNYFLFCAHQLLLILVLGHCLFFLFFRATGVILFFFFLFFFLKIVIFFFYT